MKPLESKTYVKLLNVLLFLTGLTFITTWLPFLRSIMDGASYQWGAEFFGSMYSGKGLSGDFLYVCINFVLGMGLLYSVFWIKNRKIFYGLAILWFGSMIGNAFFHVASGEGYEFHGDTLGIHVDLAYVIIPFLSLLGIFVGYMILQDRNQNLNFQWGKKNRMWARILLGLIPIQAVLLATGEAHGTTDQIGVVLAIAQVFLLNRVFKGYEEQTEVQAEFA